MSKRVFIVHGWSGFPEEGWFPWLKQQLEQDGFVVEVPTMPDTDEPKIEPWVTHLASVVGAPDEETFFVGHSIGCQTILRYLERLPSEQQVGGVVLVAPWFTLMNQSPEEVEIARPWIETPIIDANVKKHTTNFITIFSDDDDYVPIENKQMVEERFSATTILEHGKGHFSGADDVTQIPAVYEAIHQFIK